MTLAPNLTVTLADYRDPRDARAVVDLLDGYARDPMGGGAPLSDDARGRLVPALAAHPGAFSVLAYIEDEPVALANCFTGFSTFAARPLVNIHDAYVDPRFRGSGIGRALFAQVEAVARDRGACKITLEVLSGNDRAKELYASLGYSDYALGSDQGTALFWQKRLEA